MFGRVVLVWCNNGVVRAYFEHVFCALGLAAVDGKRVLFAVDGAPVGDVGLERGFDFPVFD